MTTWSQVEILVNLESFRNIDMYYQGLYNLQVSCQLAENAAEPYSIEHGYTPPPVKAPHLLHAPFISSSQSSIVSRFFLLRYSEEVVTLNETAVFRGKLPVRPGFTGVSLELRVDLFFTDLGKNTAFSNCLYMLENRFEELQFKRVSTSNCRVNSPALGVNEFFPIVFTGPYASVLTSTIHCMVFDFYFVLNGAHTQSTEEIAEILFTGELDNEKASSVYESHANLIVLAHNKLRRVLLQTMKHSGLSARRAFIPPSLKLQQKAYHNHTSKTHVTGLLRDELTALSSALCELRALLSVIIKSYPGTLLSVLEENYHDSTRARWLKNIFREQFPEEYLNPPARCLPKLHTEAAETHRRSSSFKFPLQCEIEDTNCIVHPTQHPILFEEVYGDSPEKSICSWSPAWFSSSRSESHSSGHLFVLVHGLMGTSYEMKTVKDSLLLLLPDAIVLLSQSNEDNTQASIIEMGQRLAEEVLEYVNNSFFTNELCKLSFIGHSLGGLIIRAALPHLSVYADKFNLLLTVNSPHLGVNGGSLLVAAGLWLLTKLKNSLSLRQLSLTDAPSKADSCLFKLSQMNGLSLFRYVILVGSTQDKYVPFESTRMEPTDSFSLQMAESLFCALGSTSLIRVNLNYGGLPLDFTGRKAHVAFLQSHSALSLLFYRYSEALI